MLYISQLYPYWWLLALQGVWAQEQFVREHPLHWGLGKLRQESMEGWIGLLKQYLRKHSNMRPGWMLRGLEYLDLYCVGAVYQNQVDFSAIEANHYFRQTLMYQDGITEAVQMETEAQLPQTCITILDELDTIQFGDEIVESIDVRLNGLLNVEKNRLQQVQDAYNALDDEHRRHSSIDDAALEEQQRQIDETISKKVRRTRAAFFNELRTDNSMLENIETNVNDSDSDVVQTQMNANNYD